MKKELTEEQAIKECKWLWKQIAKYENKHEYFDKHPRSKFNKYISDCPLCGWVDSDINYEKQLVHVSCPNKARVCPLIKQYGKDCFDLGYSLGYTNEDWLDAVNNLKEK